jgi:hypothetical protein
MLRFINLLASMLMLVVSSLAAEEASAFPPTRFPDPSGYGKNIQRTMRLLATSTAEHRHPVRILFYGQSITEQKWSDFVSQDLRKRFPHADLTIENRSLAGFSSQLLVKCAVTDLESFRPDLVIFHVYGAHDKYEDIIRRMRERTSAEILMQTDHVTKPEDLTEETDPAKVPIQSGKWDAFMNHNWLPSIARKYGAELCDQRSLWKAYLTMHRLEPKALLRDAVHLNAHGEWLMGECVKAYLRYDPKLGVSAAESWITTFHVGKDVAWTGDTLRLEFSGTTIEALSVGGGPSMPTKIRIDGRRPSEFPALYRFTRAVTKPEGKWPVKWPIIAPIGSQQPLLLEDWSLAVTKDAAVQKRYTFKLIGSQTGPDGEGASDVRFVSSSGRVVFEPSDWNVEYALSLAGITPPPERFEVKWKVEPSFVDEFVPASVVGPGLQTVTVLAHGLTNTKHTIELTGRNSIVALRVHQPPPGP